MAYYKDNSNSSKTVISKAKKKGRLNKILFWVIVVLIAFWSVASILGSYAFFNTVSAEEVIYDTDIENRVNACYQRFLANNKPPKNLLKSRSMGGTLTYKDFYQNNINSFNNFNLAFSGFNNDNTIKTVDSVFYAYNPTYNNALCSFTDNSITIDFPSSNVGEDYYCYLPLSFFGSNFSIDGADYLTFFVNFSGFLDSAVFRSRFSVYLLDGNVSSLQNDSLCYYEGSIQRCIFNRSCNGSSDMYLFLWFGKEIFVEGRDFDYPSVSFDFIINNRNSSDFAFNADIPSFSRNVSSVVNILECFDNTIIYDNAYNLGYSIGRSENISSQIADKYTFGNLLTSVVDAPIKVVSDWLDFNILGVNVSTFFFGLLSVAVVIFVIKLFL